MWNPIWGPSCDHPSLGIIGNERVMKEIFKFAIESRAENWNVFSHVPQKAMLREEAIDNIIKRQLRLKRNLRQISNQTRD